MCHEFVTLIESRTPHHHHASDGPKKTRKGAKAGLAGDSAPSDNCIEKGDGQRCCHSMVVTVEVFEPAWEHARRYLREWPVWCVRGSTVAADERGEPRLAAAAGLTARLSAIAVGGVARVGSRSKSRWSAEKSGHLGRARERRRATIASASSLRTIT